MFLDDELKDLRDRMSQMSDEELLRIVEVDYDDYRKEALSFAEGELARRSVPFEKPTPEVFAHSETESTPAATVTCRSCGKTMRPALLFADKELTILFSDDNEERFLRVFACSECGDVRLMVDLETEVEG